MLEDTDPRLLEKKKEAKQRKRDQRGENVHTVHLPSVTRRIETLVLLKLTHPALQQI